MPVDLILDFFAGSGTTAQAVMELNQEEKSRRDKDGLFDQTSNTDSKTNNQILGERRFILVQLPEEIDTKKEAYKAGYKKISDITIERVKRAGDKYPNVDTGFKVLKLTENSQETDLFEGLANKSNEAIFTHLALYYGYGLNYTIERISQKEIYILKPEFEEEVKNAIVILEKELLSKQDIFDLINKFGKQQYKFFAHDSSLNIELTTNILQHFKEENLITF